MSAPFKRILVPTDFSANSRQALDHAVLLASKAKADVRLSHVRAISQDDPHRPEKKLSESKAVEEVLCHCYKESMAKLAVDAELTLHRQNVRDVAVTPALLGIADESGTDLIVMGTHGRTVLGRVLIGSVAESVVRQASVPVLTVPHRDDGYELDAGYRSILVPIDFSKASIDALAEAVRLARDFGARVLAVHVMAEVPHPSFYFSDKDSLRGAFPGLRNRIRQRLEALIKANGAGALETEVAVLEGRIHREINRFATEKEADLIVIGSPHRRGFERFLLGSVTEKIIRTAPCPVLSVPHTVVADGEERETSAEDRTLCSADPVEKGGVS